MKEESSKYTGPNTKMWEEAERISNYLKEFVLPDLKSSNDRAIGTALIGMGFTHLMQTHDVEHLKMLIASICQELPGVTVEEIKNAK